MNLPTSVLFWALVVMGIVALVLFRRRRRPRAPNATIRPPAPAHESSEADYLDSSHISGPVFDDPALDAARKKATREAGLPPRGS